MFLAADSINIAISRVFRNQDPINVIAVMLGLTEKMGWPVTNQECMSLRIKLIKQSQLP